jgi:hypothetical protein
MEPQGIFMPVAAAAHHFDYEQDRIHIKMKSRIRIRNTVCPSHTVFPCLDWWAGREKAYFSVSGVQSYAHFLAVVSPIYCRHIVGYPFSGVFMPVVASSHHFDEQDPPHFIQ